MAKAANIEIKNLVKEYVSHNGTGSFLAVDSINVSIESGQFVTLLGPSGCGKTTTLRMIAGFENVTSGEILLNGECINEMTPDKRDSAMVFQSYALFPHYNVFDNVGYGLVNKKLPKGEIEKRVMEMLELVGLAGMEKRFPNQLSGGQQQRVALARALVMEPAVLLFDEPLSNLDAKLRVYMRKEIRKIQQRIGITSIYVTHDQSEAMSLSDKIIIMNKGKIEQVGSPVDIYQHPVSHFVADFIGNANFVDGEIISRDHEAGSAEIKMLGEVFVVKSLAADFAVGETVEVVIRPESIEVVEDSSIKAKVISSTYMGAMQEYALTVGDYELNTETYNPSAKRVFGAGDTVGIRIQSDSLHAIKKD